MVHYTYILFSQSHYKYYIGQSHESPERAVCQHNEGSFSSTKKGAPWRLVFSKQFENSFESYIFVQQLQNMKSRKYLRHFIDQVRYAGK